MLVTPHETNDLRFSEKKNNNYNAFKPASTVLCVSHEPDFNLSRRWTNVLYHTWQVHEPFP